MEKPVLKVQEIPFDHPWSSCDFRPGPEKPFLATPSAIRLYREQFAACLGELIELAARHGGLDYLQVFDDPEKPEPLWIIDGGDAITAVLPSDY